MLQAAKFEFRLCGNAFLGFWLGNFVFSLSSVVFVCVCAVETVNAVSTMQYLCVCKLRPIFSKTMRLGMWKFSLGARNTKQLQITIKTSYVFSHVRVVSKKKSLFDDFELTLFSRNERIQAQLCSIPIQFTATSSISCPKPPS